MFRSRRKPAPGSGLHQCAMCHDDYVVPVWWEPVGEDEWHMLLRCAQCETHRYVTVPDEVAKAFDRDLERNADLIRAALARMDRARMAVQAETFVAALNRDLIDAGDFAGR